MAPGRFGIYLPGAAIPAPGAWPRHNLLVRSFRSYRYPLARLVLSSDADVFATTPPPSAMATVAQNRPDIGSI
jgi:hypothetical protein